METVGKILQAKKGLQQQQVSLKDCSQQTSKLIAKFGDLGSFVKKFNPSYQREICEKKDECFFGNYPTLAELKAAYGTNAPMIWLVPQLYHLSEYCGCKDKLTEKQLEECAYIIASEYYYLKVSELMLWLHRFKAGKYGRFFNRYSALRCLFKINIIDSKIFNRCPLFYTEISNKAIFA